MRKAVRGDRLFSRSRYLRSSLMTDFPSFAERFLRGGFGVSISFLLGGGPDPYASLDFKPRDFFSTITAFHNLEAVVRFGSEIVFAFFIQMATLHFCILLVEYQASKQKLPVFEQMQNAFAQGRGVKSAEEAGLPVVPP